MTTIHLRALCTYATGRVLMGFVGRDGADLDVPPVTLDAATWRAICEEHERGAVGEETGG